MGYDWELWLLEPTGDAGGYCHLPNWCGSDHRAAFHCAAYGATMRLVETCSAL